jgi:glycosyltransferase involved in cell wall biosynthesis
MEKGLISVITPCYNTGKYIHYLLDSLLCQTYPKVEIFAVDDGSTDNTAEIIKSYIPKFKLKGYSLNYIFQKNSGQSVAINNALKLINGEFFVWPDSDDFYASKDSLAILKETLDKSDYNVSMVRCLYSYLDQNDLSMIWQQKDEPYMHKDNLFEDCLFQLNGWNFCPGGYMVRMDIFDKCIPNRDIYTEHDAGQNWQLMTPLLYNYKCVTIPKHLYNTVVRRESHSHGQYKTYEEIRRKFKSYENTILGTLDRMPFLNVDERIRYQKAIRLKYARIQLNICYTHKKKEDSKKVEKYIRKELGVHLSLGEKMDSTFCCVPGYFTLKNFPKKVYNRTKGLAIVVLRKLFK